MESLSVPSGGMQRGGQLPFPFGTELRVGGDLG